MMTEAERDLQRFEDILKEIVLIRESLKGLDKDAFLSSEDKKAAVAHHLTVIGEAADCIREKYLARLHQELPHELGVLVKRIKESQPNGEEQWEVEVAVLVNRASQKPIVIGKGAETVKYVRKCAERELSDVFGVRVRMEIWVQVEPNWMKNERLLTEMGYLGELV